MIAAAPRLAIDDVDLHHLLRSAMVERFGREPGIAQISRFAWDYYSSFAMERLEVMLQDGGSISLLAKDLGSSGRLEEGSGLKPDFVYDPMREIEMYRSVLGARGILATATEPGRAGLLFHTSFSR